MPVPIRSLEHEATNLQFAPGNEPPLQVEPFATALPVCLRFGGSDRRRTAVDISEQGMFVESPDHLAPGELVQILIALPDEKALRVLSTVERVVTPDEAVFYGGMPGMGLRFFMMDERLRARWRRYLLVAQQGRPRKPADPVATEHSVSRVALSRRNEDRKPARFRVRLADRASLQTFYTGNISRGGMFLTTDRLQEKGSRLRLVVRHPVTGREFPLEAEVRWVQSDGPAAERGMGVQLVGRDLHQEEAFLRFINSG